MATPAQLMADAQCIFCEVPPGMVVPVMIALTASIAGVSTEPQSLLNSAGCVHCEIPPGLELPVLIAVADLLANP